MTNGDKIRNMSNEELALLINESRDFFSCNDCSHEQDNHCKDDCLPYIKNGLKANVVRRYFYHLFDLEVRRIGK